VSPEGAAHRGFLFASDGTLFFQAERNLVRADDGVELLTDPHDEILTSTLVAGRPAVLIGNRLYAVAGGVLSALVEVPLKEVVVAGSDRMVYIAGVTESGRSLLFAYDEKLGHQPILELPEPITAMTVTDAGRVLFASGTGFFTFVPGKETIPVAILPNMAKISALAVTPDFGLIFASDGEGTYALLPDDGRIVLLFRDAGGQLGIHDGSLYLLRNQDQSLFRIDRLEETLAQRGAPLVSFGNDNS